MNSTWTACYTLNETLRLVRLQVVREANTTFRGSGLRVQSNTFVQDVGESLLLLQAPAISSHK